MGAVKSERGAPPHRPYPKLSPPGAVPSKTSGDPQFVHVHVTQRKSSPRLVTFPPPSSGCGAGWACGGGREVEKGTALQCDGWLTPHLVINASEGHKRGSCLV